MLYKYEYASQCAIVKMLNLNGFCTQVCSFHMFNKTRKYNELDKLHFVLQLFLIEVYCPGVIILCDH